MADLRELHAALEALMYDGRTAKVTFYYLEDSDTKMHSGSIIVERGVECRINFPLQPPEAALDAIARLRFTKITTLPEMLTDHSGDPVPAVTINAVLEKLDPARLPKPAPTPAPVPRPTVSEAPAAKQPHVFYSHLAMQKDALDLLEPLFGIGAHKKVEEFAHQSPPHQHPADFLSKCRQHAAMMLGAKKAEELFKPIFEKLSH